MLRQLRLFARNSINSTLYWSGAGALFEFATRPAGAIILMYHSIAPDDVAESIDPPNRMSPALFEAQMAYLSKHRRVVPFSEVIEQIASGMSPPAGTVCITFDDGYLDNLTVAAPILERYKLPATLYLATGYVRRSEAQWADSLHSLFKWRTRNRLRVSCLGPDAADLASAASRAAIRTTLHRHLLEATCRQRKQLLRDVERQLKPKNAAPRLTLNWEDVRELRRRYPFFEIGGHTREHIDLRKHHGDRARSEIDGCAEDLRRELGMTPLHFSFPYGRWCDESRRIVCVSGWQSAVGSNTSIRVDKLSDRFAIPRIEAPRSMTELRFKTSGAYPGALSLLGMK